MDDPGLEVDQQIPHVATAVSILVVLAITVFFTVLCISKHKPKKKSDSQIPLGVTFSQGNAQDIDFTAPQSPLMKTITTLRPVQAYEMKAKASTPCTLRRQEVRPDSDSSKRDSLLSSTGFLHKPWHTIGAGPGSRAQIYNQLVSRNRANTTTRPDRSSVLSRDTVDGGLAMSLQTIPQVLLSNPNELSLQRSNTLDLDLSLFSSEPLRGFTGECTRPSLLHALSVDAIMHNSPRQYENLALYGQSGSNLSDDEKSCNDTTEDEDEEDFSATGPLRVESKLDLAATNTRHYENILSTPEGATSLDKPGLMRTPSGKITSTPLALNEKSKTPVYMNLPSPTAAPDKDEQITSSEASETFCKLCAAELSNHLYVNATADMHHPSCRNYENVPLGMQRRLSAAGRSGYEEPVETAVLPSTQVETLSGIAVALADSTNDYSHLKRQSIPGGQETASEENGYSHLPTVVSASMVSQVSNSSEETLAYDHLPMHPNTGTQQRVIEGDYAELDQQRVKSHDYDELPVASSVPSSHPSSRPSSARSGTQQQPALQRRTSHDVHSDYGSDCARQDSQSALTSSGQETDATPYSTLTHDSDKQETADIEFHRRVSFGSSTEVLGSLDRHGKAAQGVLPLRKMSEPIIAFHDPLSNIKRNTSTPEVPNSPRPHLTQSPRPVIEVSEVRMTSRPLDLLAEAAHSYATADEVPPVPPQVPTSPQRPLHMIVRRPSVEIGSYLGTNELDSVGSMGDLNSSDISATPKSSEGVFRSPSRDQFAIGLSPTSNYKELSRSPLGSTTDLTLPTTKF